MPTITLKNYRGFADERPLRIEIGKQFVGLVGPNNSGKSSFLLCLYELRDLWNRLQHSGSVGNLISPAPIDVNPYPAVGDAEELFHNGNNRDITIELDVSDMDIQAFPGAKPITKFIARCNRASKQRWYFSVFSGDQQVVANNPQGWVDQNKFIWHIQNTRYDFSNICRLASDLAQTLYIGPFRSIIGQVSGPYYDLEIGSNFINTWHNWKSGGSKESNLAIGSITQTIKEIFKLDQLEINPLAGSVGLHVWLNHKPYRLSELGAGLAQFIVVFANAAIKKPRIILIDEPELNLHPMLQMNFLTSLASYAQSGIIFATHSIGLARAVSDDIYTFKKDQEAISVQQFHRTASYAEFLGEMSFASIQENGYDCLLLVEGVNDVRTIHQFLRTMKKEHAVVVMQLGGNELAKGGRELELGEIRRLSENIYALVDSERSQETDPPAEQRIAFAGICDTLKIPLCITQRRAIENYLTDRAVKTAFGPSHNGLSPYEAFAANTHGWKKSEGWRVAREMSLEEIRGTDLYDFLDRLPAGRRDNDGC